MGDRSGIEWTDATWNPTTGCDQVSPGCDNCYALTLAGRLKGMGSPAYQNDGDPRTSGPGFKLTLHPDRLDQPLRWTKPRRVFVNSMSDLFHPDVPQNFIAEVFAVMAVTRRHSYQILTKRPQRMASVVAEDGFRSMDIPEYATDLMAGPLHRSVEIHHPDWYAVPAGGWNVWHPRDWPLRNVWLGTSIESDRYAFRARHLLETPAAVRFLSLEPLLGPLPSLNLTGIDWVIVGGESGAGHRPIETDWVRDIRDRCLDVGVPFFFKQWGGRTAKAGGRELDGRTWDEYPEVVYAAD